MTFTENQRRIWLALNEGSPLRRPSPRELSAAAAAEAAAAKEQAQGKAQVHPERGADLGERALLGLARASTSLGCGCSFGPNGQRRLCPRGEALAAAGKLRTLADVMRHARESGASDLTTRSQLGAQSRAEQQKREAAAARAGAGRRADA